MGKRITIVSAVWCPSCLILKKHIKKISEEYQDIEIKYLDYDLDEEDVLKLNVGDKLPVIIAYQSDNEINRLIGEKTYEEIVEFIKESGLV